jgi:uncharacterized membrane protein
MSAARDDRVAALERDLQTLTARVHEIERELAGARGGTSTSPASTAIAPVAAPASATPASTAVAPAAAPPSAPPPTRPPQRLARPPLDLEELLGGRLLALVGGVAVLLGLAFFVALAADRGWIGETARVLLAFSGSAALVAAGVWLFEAKRRNQAALAAIGTGVSGLFLSLTAASALYGLLPEAIALGGALVVGSLATALAVRLSSRTVAALGILGALSGSALVGATERATAPLFLAIALAGSAGVLIWRRWDWLRVAAFTMAMAQVAVWSYAAQDVRSVLAVLALVGAINVVLAVGYELRAPVDGLRASSALIATANAIVVGGIGYAAIVFLGEAGARAGGAWVAAIAVAHAALGLALLAFRPVSRNVALVLLGVSLTSADIAAALLVDGAALAVGWAASAAALAYLARRFPEHSELATASVGGQLALATAHALLFDAPVDAALADSPRAGAVAAVAAVGVCAFAAARMGRPESLTRRVAFDALSIGAVAYATAVAFEGLLLVVAYVVEAGALAAVVRRTRDVVAAYAATAFVALAAAHTLVFEAPPDALVHGVDDLLSAAAAVVLLAGAAVAVGRTPTAAAATRRAAYFGAGGALVYLGSITIVDSFQPGSAALAAGIDLDVRQQGQALLSVFWSVCGLSLLWAGLRAEVAQLRLAGFALLGLAVGKVFAYDLSELDSAYRVLSFIVLGLLLLVAAFAYQRMRRRETDDVSLPSARSS